MVESYPAGNFVLSIQPQRVRAAVDALFCYVDESSLRKLKVRSGEHLAAILTTAFLGVTPRAVDTAGGPDLEFDLVARDDELLSSLFTSTAVTFEIKSLDNGFRRFDGAIGDDVRQGRPVRNPVRAVQVTTAQAVLDAAGQWLDRAGEQLRGKVDDTASKNVFLIVHLLDYLPAEYVRAEGVLGPLLGPLDCPDLDTVWVLWGADYLTVWSGQRQEWINFLYAAAWSQEELDEQPDDAVLLHEVEADFLTRLGWHGDSPYLFRLSAD